MPIRVQRKRVKGWKMPPNTVSVTRPGRWGNPYKVVDIGDGCFNVVYVTDGLLLLIAFALPFDMALKLSLEKYESGLNREAVKKELKGKNLACFCPLSQKCHSEVLLKIANK